MAAQPGPDRHAPPAAGPLPGAGRPDVLSGGPGASGFVGWLSAGVCVLGDVWERGNADCIIRHHPTYFAFWEFFGKFLKNVQKSIEKRCFLSVENVIEHNAGVKKFGCVILHKRFLKFRISLHNEFSFFPYPISSIFNKTISSMFQSNSLLRLIGSS